MLFGSFGGGKIAPGKASFPGGGATKATGFNKTIPTTSVETVPFWGGGFGKKPFGKPGFGKKPFGKSGFGKFGKPGFGKFGKPGFGKTKTSFGKPGFGKFTKPSLTSGFNFVVPTTTVATTPSTGGGGKFGI